MKKRVLIVESKADIEKFNNWVLSGSFVNDKNIDDVKELIQYFLDVRKNIKSPYNDFYWWQKNSNQTKFINYIQDLKLDAESRQNVKQKEKEGARLVYSDNDWKVYEITTYEASAKYGKGTKWCISGSKRWANGEEGAGYFDQYYSQNGVRFYFFIKSTGEKYALAVYPNNSCEIFNAEDVGIPYIPDAPVVKEIKAEYKNESDINILINAIMNKKIDEHILQKLIAEVANDNTGFEYMIFGRNDVDDLISTVDGMIPDGYLEFDDEDGWWDGDIPAFEPYELDIIGGSTKQEKLDTLRKILTQEKEYIVLEESYDGWMITPLEDYTQLFLWANDRCNINDWTDGELDDFFINSLDANDLEHVHGGVMSVFPLMLANRLIADIKSGDISKSVLNNVGLSTDFLNKLSESFDKTINEDEKVSQNAQKQSKLSKEQEDFFKDSVIRDKNGNLLTMWHGSNVDFKNFSGKINWFTRDRNYANMFATWLGGKPVFYEAYLNCKKLLNCGDTNARVFELSPIKPYKFSRESLSLMRKLGIDEDDFRRLIKHTSAETDEDEFRLKLNAITRLPEFAELVKYKGFDSIYTIEDGHQCVGVFNPEDIKRVNNLKPTSSVNIDEDYKTPNFKETIQQVANKLNEFANTGKFVSHGIDKDSACIVLPSGEVYSLYSVETHPELAGVIASSFGHKYEDYEDLDYLYLEYLQDKLGILTLNSGLFGYEDRCKIVCSTKPTSAQCDAILEFLDLMSYSHRDGDLLHVYANNQFQTYEFGDFIPEDIVRKIRKAFAFGRLEEKNLKEYFEVVNSRDYASYPIFATDSAYQIKNMLLRDNKAYRILYSPKYNNYFIQDASGDKTHYDMIKVASKNGWDIDTNGSYKNANYMVFIPRNFKGDLIYYTALGEDSYYNCRVYSCGVIYVRDVEAYNNSLFQAMGKPEREIFYDWRREKITINSNGKTIKIEPKDIRWQLDKVITMPLELKEEKAITWGDLDYGKKADTRDKMMGRGTGHFGTGFYFVGANGKYGIANKDKFYDYEPTRPIYEIDLDAYKLYRPKDNDSAYRLHDTLSYINNYYDPSFDAWLDKDFNLEKIEDEMYNLGWEADDYDITEDVDDDLDIDDDIFFQDLDDEEESKELPNEEDKKYLERYRELAKKFIEKYNLQDWVSIDIDKESSGTIERALERALKDFEKCLYYTKFGIKSLSEIFNISKEKLVKIIHDAYMSNSEDSISTMIIKALGYEGIDVTHLNKDAQGLSGLDNFGYGTVIYDLKPGTYKRIMEPRQSRKEYYGEDLSLNEMKGKGNIQDEKILKYIDECINEMTHIEFDKYDYTYLTYDDIVYEAGDTANTFGTMMMPKVPNGDFKLVLNKHMFNESEEAIKNTIYHELCHYVVMKTAIELGMFYWKNGNWYIAGNKFDIRGHDAKDYKSHGKVWQEVADKVGSAVGQKISRTDSYDMHTGVGQHAQDIAKYIVQCKHCGRKYMYQKKTQFVNAIIDGNGHTEHWWCNCSDGTKSHDFELLKGN